MASKFCGGPGFKVAAALLAAVALTIALAEAQSLPPPGAYRPIPNFTGVGAGLLFRTAINDRFSGVEPIAPTLISIAFADLPQEEDGGEFYCHDCQATTPCTGGGAGAWVFGERGVWNCVAGSFDETTGGDLSGPFSNATVNTVQAGKTPVTSSYRGALSLTGNSGDGSDQISGVSVNGAINPRAFGAVGLTTASACSTVANSNLVTISPAGDFQNGQAVMCAHAGAANTATAPSALTVLATDVSGAGATTWTYNICTFDAVTGQMSGCVTQTATNAATLNSALSGENNLLHWTKGTGGTATVIYNQTGVIGLIPLGVTSFRDVGQGIESFNEIPATPPTGPLNQRLSTTITSGEGTTSLLLATAATAGISGQYFSHDDTAAIQSAFAAAQSNQTTLRFPTGKYNYFGAGLSGASQKFLSIEGEPPLKSISSDPASQSAIYLAAGGYFIDNSAAIVQVQLRNMTFVGGLGAFRSTSTGAVGVGERKFYNNAFLDFTGCAVCWNEADSPYHYVENNNFRGLDSNATIGYGYAGNNDSSHFVNNTLNRVRIGIADAGKGLGRNYVNSNFIRSSTAPFSRADIWFSNTGISSAATVTRERFANENIKAGDYHVLVADADSATLVGDQFPLAPHANYGAGEIILDGAITSGGAALTSNTAHFLTSAHISDWVRIKGAGTQGTCVCELVGQINSIDSDVQVTLDSSTPNASATVSSAMVFFGTASSKEFQQIAVTDSWIAEGAVTPQTSLVYTTARTMMGWSITGNTLYTPSINGPLLQYLPLSATNARSNLNLIANNNGASMGASTDPSQGMYASNNISPVMLVDPLIQMTTWNQPPPYQTTTNNAGAIDYLPGTTINSFSLSTGVTRSAITDRSGGSDAAEVNFTSSTNPVTLIFKTFTPSVLGLSWVTFDFKKASSSALTHFFVSVAKSSSPGCCAGGVIASRQIDIPETGEWYTLSIPFVPTDTTTSINLSFQAVGVDPSIETGSIDIGRVHVYQHETPVDLSILQTSAAGIEYGLPSVAMGGGAAPTLGTIGGGGPATAGQNSWLKLFDSTGAAIYVPIWK
ncbi:MAG: hypothetical protein Q7S58_00270 [Candidatus Binatus sp.]|uniref:hypothetical protein n=1 Tax=Candidatus Binatus sp. TaxID=2811406 RepID=UPI0027250184|nr:hypothetical protein [Candidatus Binatus sp.]MDO8430820.1 hypothetical protein [Candidatus Binatus sp.]